LFLGVSIIGLGLILYILLSKWRSLPISFTSALFFLLNYTILVLYFRWFSLVIIDYIEKYMNLNTFAIVLSMICS
jgi:hypothetical protein